MMRHRCRLALALFAVLPLLPGVARGQTMDELIKRDPVCQKWLNYNLYKVEVAKQLKEDCYQDVSRCSYGWDAFVGKAAPAAAGFFKDSLATAVVGGKPVFKLGFGDPEVGPRGTLGLVLWNVPGAADVLASSIDSLVKLEHLWCRGKWTPYRGLWLLGAKGKVETMIAGLPSLSCESPHLEYFLPRLDAWELTPAQQKTVTSWCTDKVFTSTTHQQYVPYCVR
jgi:hypothetical protein